MDENTSVSVAGCGQRLIILLSLLWLGLAPVGSSFLADLVLGDVTGARMVDAGAVLLTGLVLVLPFVGLALVMQRRRGQRYAAAVAASFATAGGYIVLDGAVGLIPVGAEVVPPLWVHYAVGGLQLLIIGYGFLSACLAAHLLGFSEFPNREWLGLGRSRRRTILLGLVAGGLVTLPWPVTGALGDSLTSLALSVQTLLRIVPEVLIFWGVIFHLLIISTGRTGAAAISTTVLYGLSVLGRAGLGVDGSIMDGGVFLLPLALLLSEIRVRGNSIFSLLPLAFCYRVMPVLFLDPRDVIFQGIPELQHVVSYAVVALATVTLTVVLWLGRRASGQREPQDACQQTRWVGVGLLAVALWGVWGGLYLRVGQPGFFNDGFLIILDEQASLSPAYEIVDREERLSFVRDRLLQAAESTQSPLRRELEQLGVPYRPYYLINMIRVDGHRWLMGRFEGRTGVAQVILNPNVRRYPRRIPIPYEDATEPIRGVQGNLSAIHADVAWSLGITGERIVVGGQDSGYDWEHPALKSHYRGWNGVEADHDYNWHDAWDDTRVPFDEDSHGTYTMGTVLGDDGNGNRTGVAPGAVWIGCRSLRRGIGNPGAYAECMEFFLAPYPLGGDPFRDGDIRLAPQVTNNSWGCPAVEGCLPDTLRSGVEALRAAGVMMVVSAGNDGAACQTAGTCPANYDASFTVGATTNEGTILGLSSRGPVDGLIKPDIAAPGQRVRSSVPGGGYAFASGTSAAAPHVAGAVALLWSADEALMGDIEATEALLCQAAVSKSVSQSCGTVSIPEGPLPADATPPPCACGGIAGVPNNVYGCGLLDAGNAVRLALEE